MNDIDDLITKSTEDSTPTIEINEPIENLKQEFLLTDNTIKDSTKTVTGSQLIIEAQRRFQLMNVQFIRRNPPIDSIKYATRFLTLINYTVQPII